MARYDYDFGYSRGRGGTLPRRGERNWERGYDAPSGMPGREQGPRWLSGRTGGYDRGYGRASNRTGGAGRYDRDFGRGGYRGGYDRGFRSAGGGDPATDVRDPYAGPFAPGRGVTDLGAGRPRPFVDYGGGEQTGHRARGW